MLPKKTKRADLERWSSLFLLIGLVIALGAVFTAFQYKTSPQKVASLGQLEDFIIDEDVIPPTREPEMKQPEPPPAKKVIEIINIVDDNTDIDNQIDIDDSEADNNTVINIEPFFELPKEDPEEDKIYVGVVQEMPEFPGGQKALMHYLAKSVDYPSIAQENGIQGKVYINFVVNKDGSICDVKVVRSVEASLDKEAVRVVKSMPRWKPGKQQGKAVRVSYHVPINFVLQ